MKTLSVALNLVLLCCIGLLLVGRRRGPLESLPTASRFPLSRPPTEKAQSEKPVLTAARPSRWSDLESTDYRVYITNLRRFGCPEQTLRDIISADVASLYAAKRQELRLGERTTAGAWSTEEERRLTAFLLGGMPPDPGDTSQPAITPVVPLVLQKVDLTALGLNEDQKAAVEELRNQFLNEIGGTEQNPSDPAYAERWRKAQPENDAMLRGMIGVSAFMRYQNEAE